MECESSLKRLKTDVIDLYQIHWPDPSGEIEEGWTEIAKLVEEGKIRYAGVSNFTVEHLRDRAGHSPGGVTPAALQHVAARHRGCPVAVLRRK